MGTGTNAADLEDLARRARAGERDASTELLRQLYPIVRKQIHFVIGSDAETDDAVQETLLALHRALPRFRGDASVRTWAIAIALRVARRVRHGASRRPPAVTDLEIAVFDTDLSGAAELAMLRRLLARLSPKKREAFVLMGILELTAEEAGRALGTSANTAASRYRHGRGELETYLLRDQAAAAAGEREALTSLAASAPPKKGES